MSRRPVFRFAPSPNGLLHLGHAFSALLNADLAREADGRLLVRIEDIDPGRSTAEFEAAIFEDLGWLGLEWQRPVRRQSEHLQEHAAVLRDLAVRGLIYPCSCTRGEIRAAVAARKHWPSDPDGAPLYPGTCRPRTCRIHEFPGARAAAWRLDMQRALADLPDGLTWTELGEDGNPATLAADPATWGDVVLARRDVPTSYHLAVVLDDAAQGVTHIVRGRDLYFATAVHRLLQALLGLPEPIYRHHKLILGPDGKKLAKSSGSESLRGLRQAGVSPERIRAFVGLS